MERIVNVYGVRYILKYWGGFFFWDLCVIFWGFSVFIVNVRMIKFDVNIYFGFVI